MFQRIVNSKLEGCYEIFLEKLNDKRGYFVKTVNEDMFQQFSFSTDFKEDYYSFSVKNVLRGLHFQTPPMEHEKLVHCISGTVMDVVVDLRVGSRTYGEYDTFELSSEKANMVYLPKGFAHGFYTLSEEAILTYKVTSVYSPLCDSGILWSSVGIPWTNMDPIISKRDSELIDFKDFKSPFKL